MTVNQKREGRCVMVGLDEIACDDGGGREMLNWALGKIAKQGDCVVAVHVCRNSDSSDPSTLSLIQVLEDYLKVYQGLCRLKQVVLVGRVSRGTSIRKVLVREAGILGAVAVVVGVSKNFSLGGSASIAKYCAKKLPPITALIALHNGKVVFKRESLGGKDQVLLRSLLHPSLSMENPEATSDPSSVTVLVRKLPDSRPGWPLLRRATSANLDTSEARNMSVVQWVMKTMPNRSLLPIQSHPSATFELLQKVERILKDNHSRCKWFTYEELQVSTSHFSSENFIGNGGSSRVYKGCLPSGQEVAIKLPNLSEDEASGDVLLEVDIITTLQHGHIVSLTGICIQDNNVIFVYTYLPRGNLEENLHGKSGKSTLPWDMRFKVAIGMAEALNYLHKGCYRPVIHRDVKSSNILLSNEFEPQLSDFNLSLWAPTATSHLTHTDVLGTFGYLAPEYFMYGRVSDKIDVYAYGVVLLELLTGRKPISNENPQGQESLVMWATPVLERGDFIELLDPNLDGNYDEDQMRRMSLAASLCIARAARLRPPMSQILRLLRGEDNVEGWMDLHTKSTPDDQDDEAYPASSIRSHLGLALLDVDDDASVTSFEQNNLSSLEEYLQGRWSRSSSFD